MRLPLCTTRLAELGAVAGGSSTPIALTRSATRAKPGPGFTPGMTAHELSAARLRSLARLSRAFAHEIRGASSALAIHTELLAGSVDAVEDEAVRERQRRYVRVLVQERQRIQRLVDVLLGAVAPLDDAAAEPFDLSEVLADLHALLGPQAVERRAPLDLTSAGPLPMTGRRRVVEQAVLDVLLWALDRAPKGTRVDVAVEDEPQRVRIVIGTSGAFDDAGDPAFDACDQLVRLAGGTVRTGPAGGHLEVELPRTGPVGDACHA